MEVRLHYVMLEELENSVLQNDAAPVDVHAIARITIVRGADAGDVDFDIDVDL